MQEHLPGSIFRKVDVPNDWMPMMTRNLAAMLLLAAALPWAHVGAFGFSLADVNCAIDPNGDQDPGLPTGPCDGQFPLEWEAVPRFASALGQSSPCPDGECMAETR